MEAITMRIDYCAFVRLCRSAAFLDDCAEYHEALWEYFSEVGEISGDALEFFDNLFQYTAWYESAEDFTNDYSTTLNASGFAAFEEERCEVLNDFIDQYRFGVDEPVIRDLYTGMIYGLC